MTMRKIQTLVILFGILVVAGCRAQVQSNPTITVCPPTTSGNYYVALNATAPVSGLTYSDVHPAAGSYCYVVQSVAGLQTSLPSNIAGPNVLSGSNSTRLNWNPPALCAVGDATCVNPTGYMVLRAVAISSTLYAPTAITGTVAEVKPALVMPENKRPVYSMLEPLRLTGSVQ